MNKQPLLISIILLSLLSAVPALAQRVELDDSLSPQKNFNLDLKWSPRELGLAIDAMFKGRASDLPPLTGQIPRIDTRLNTQAYIGQFAKIYLTLPNTITGRQSPSNIELSWRTRGLFIAGSVRPGQSTLIYEGPIEEAITQEVMDFTIVVETGDIPDNFIIEPKYEIEVTP